MEEKKVSKEMTIQENYSLQETIAAELFEGLTYPWEALPNIGAFIKKLGPTLPAFVSPNVLNYLVENFGIQPITTPEEDLKAILK